MDATIPIALNQNTLQRFNCIEANKQFLNTCVVQGRSDITSNAEQYAIQSCLEKKYVILDNILDSTSTWVLYFWLDWTFYLDTVTLDVDDIVDV